MRKAVTILAALMLAGTAFAGTNLVRSHVNRVTTSPSVTINVAVMQAKVKALVATEAANTNVYVGANFCLACHQDAAGWMDTRHDQMIRKPMAKWTLVAGKGVIANQAGATSDDFMVGLDLGTLPAFAVYGANAPKLSYDAATDSYYMSIGGLKTQLFFTLAGSEGQSQRFLVKVPVTDTASGYTNNGYFAPIQYTPGSGWSAYSPAAWYDSSNAPKIVSGMTASQVAHAGLTSHAKGCIGCHATGIRGVGVDANGEGTFRGYIATLAADDDPAYFDYNGDGNKELLNIECEACHGPGGNHILGGGDPTQIVNPAKLTGQQSVEICGRCHIRGGSVPNHTYAWPYHDDTDTNWIPMQSAQWVPLDSFNSTVNLKYFGDGVLPSNPRPYDVYKLSAHYATHYGQNGSSEACGGSCHEMHGETSNPAQVMDSRYDAQTKLTIPTNVDNDSFCLSCHATHGSFASITKQQVADYANNVDAIGKVVAAHTNHPFAPARTMGLSRCVECHMSATGNHTFFVTKPEDTIKYIGTTAGYPNACADSCHNTRVNLFGLGLDPSTSTWNKDFDKANATVLVRYYGPGGTWWDTTPH